MKLFVGLGNPGGKYSGNRHNVGFMAIDTIAADYGFSSWRKRFQGETADGMIDDHKVLMLKPATFMNDSGKAVGAAVRFLKIDLADVVVFYDEIDLAPGKLKVKTGGGNAGHNGLRSITHLVGNDYSRVRIGVGHPGVKEMVAGYVLHDFSRDDKTWLTPMLEAMSDAAPHLAGGDGARFMSDVATTLNPAPPKPAKKLKSSADRGASNARTTASAAAPGEARSGKPEAKPQAKPQTGSQAGAQAGAQAEPQKQASPEKTRKSTPRHPAGERQSKQQSALAANLQKWLQGRDKK